MKKAALTALVLGSLAHVSGDQMMIKDPAKEFKAMGDKYRFGDRIEPKKPATQAPVKSTAQPAATQPESEPAPAAAKPKTQTLEDPFNSKNLHLTCGAKCGIPLSDQNRS